MSERRKRIGLYQGPKNSIRPDELESYERTGQWAFEEKHDGVWACATVIDGVITQMTSRVGLPMDADGIIGMKLPGGGGSGQLVGELTADLVGDQRSGTRRFRLFDVLDWLSVDFCTMPLFMRRAGLETIYQCCVGATDRITLTEQRLTGALAFYSEVIARGGEGLVLKRLDSTYSPRNADGKVDCWLRCKPKRTVDYVIMGHGVAEKGTPNLELGLWKDCKLQGRKLVKVLTCSIPVAPAFRSLQLDSLIGHVVEVEGAEVWPSGALRHAVIQRLRDDKPVQDCTHEAAMRVR
jgi:ATP-dependent DNA ligase